MADQINDVNVDAMRDFDKKLRESPAIGRRTMKVRSSWLRGTKAVVELGEHHVDGQRVTPPTRKFVLMGDAPPPLGGADHAPAATELLLGAVAGCIMSGIAANAALFDVPIDGIEIDVDGDIDLRGIFGHDKSVRNGFNEIRYRVTIHSSAPEEKVRRCKETIDRKSPVLDSILKGVAVKSQFVYKPR
jgi:uncharacterized OsmC-like protein